MSTIIDPITHPTYRFIIEHFTGNLRDLAEDVDDLLLEHVDRARELESRVEQQADHIDELLGYAGIVEDDLRRRDATILDLWERLNLSIDDLEDGDTRSTVKECLEEKRRQAKWRLDPLRCHADHLAAAKEAAALLAAAIGQPGDKVTVSMSGHANPGHANPFEGWGNEFIQINVSIQY